MILRIVGTDYYDNCIIGNFFINDFWLCYSLEDKLRKKKIYGKTAIPNGEYKVVLDHSYKYNRVMPHILDVPNFKGVRIHKGNTEKDTEGCVLLGAHKGEGYIYNCSRVYNKLVEQMQEAIENGEEIKIILER